MEMPKKLMSIKAEDLMEHAREHGNVKWLKAKAAEISGEESNNMKAFAKLRKAYLAEFIPEMLEKKKSSKKSKSIFDKIAEMED